MVIARLHRAFTQAIGALVGVFAHLLIATRDHTGEPGKHNTLDELTHFALLILTFGREITPSRRNRIFVLGVQAGDAGAADLIAGEALSAPPGLDPKDTTRVCR
jgi:hypothetical protein